RGGAGQGVDGRAVASGGQHAAALEAAQGGGLALLEVGDDGDVAAAADAVDLAALGGRDEDLALAGAGEQRGEVLLVAAEPGLPGELAGAGEVGGLARDERDEHELGAALGGGGVGVDAALVG